jgi:hypothetical protein
MKNVIIKISILQLLLANSALAQQKQAGGIIKFGVTYPMLSADMQQVQSMLPKEMTLYFKGSKSRLEMQGANLGNMITLTDTLSDSTFILVDFGGQKRAIVSTKADNMNMPKPQVTVDRVASTKQILGYSCNKAVVNVKQGNESYSFEAYYTTKLPAIALQTTDFELKELNGMLLEYSVDKNGIKMTFTAKSIVNDIPSEELFLIPEGYLITPIQAIQQLMQGGIPNEK